MLRLALFLLVAAVLVVPAFARDNDAKENDPSLPQAVRKTAAQDSYSFRVQEKPAVVADMGLEGTYQKGRPLHLKAGGIEMYRKGAVLVYKDGGRWLATKTGVQSDPLRVLGATAMARSVRLPHEEIAQLGKLLKEVQAPRKEDGGRVYSAALDREAAQKLARTEHQSVAQGGRARLWVSSEGLISKYEVVLELKGRLGNAEIDGSATRTVSLLKAGKAKVEVPEEARKILK